MSHVFAIRPRTMMWLPAALLLSWGLLSAAGVPLSPNSNAASTGTSTVSAIVDPELHIGTGGAQCGGASLTGATLTPDGTTDTIGDCTLTFGTNNNATGALIRVRSGRPNDATVDETFCSTAAAASCGATNFTDVAHTGAASLATGQFGVLVNGAPTCTNAVWTNGNYYGLRDANEAAGGGGTVDGDMICDHQTNASDASYPLRFRANAGGSQVATTYNGSAVFQVLAS